MKPLTLELGLTHSARRSPEYAITRFRRSELARLALVPSRPPEQDSRTTGVHERRPALAAELASARDADPIEDIHPTELEYTATLLELGALSLRPSALHAREADARERAPHLYRHALRLARERGPYASPAAIEGAVEALRIVHGDGRTLSRSIDRARRLLASLRPTGSDDPSR